MTRPFERTSETGSLVILATLVITRFSGPALFGLFHCSGGIENLLLVGFIVCFFRGFPGIYRS